MADVPRPENSEPNPPVETFTYRVHYAREMKIPKGGSVVFGEEARLQALTREDADREFRAFIKDRAGDPLLSGFILLEIRWLKPSA